MVGAYLVAEPGAWTAPLVLPGLQPPAQTELEATTTNIVRPGQSL